MTVTLFEAVPPPVTVVSCGEEGGMQQALLCSQDWTTGTLYRETVLRMETRVWDKTVGQDGHLGAGQTGAEEIG